MPIVTTILYYSVPAVIAAATAEALVLSFLHRAYDWRAYFASLADLLVRDYLVYVYLPFGLALPAVGWAWQHRVATIPLDTFSAVALLFLGQEFCYYWFHRCSHRVRWLWASHAVHHSPNELNLSAAYRFGWTARLSGSMIFYVPMIWLGFAPRAVFTTLSLNLLYQFWLHTGWAPKLGPFELVLNTPSHHRVHHATNPEYLDRNYGGVLIVFDRLFGTFAAEREKIAIRYGLVEPLYSHNPVWIAFHAWVALGRDLWRAADWRERGRVLFGPPVGHAAMPEDCRAVAIPAE